MKPALFLSYCRREAPFADSLLERLEQADFKVWMDYHSLIPGQPWKDQIEAGLVEAEVVLLVVSKEALASKYVEVEWQRAIELGKRIVLIIFESVVLPPELAQYEWVDFRSAFKKGFKELEERLKQAAPVKQAGAPPQKGFKTPGVVWASFWVSLMVVLISLPAFWTLYIPYYLLPLPYKILKRNFNFFEVQSALIILPFALFLTDVFLNPRMDAEPAAELIMATIASIFFVPFLLFLLCSAGMQRWGKPIASRPKFANPYNPRIKNPQPISFTVDYAPEDKKYADDIIKALQRYGHRYVEAGQNVEAVFVLISTYKHTTVYDPEVQVIYPIMLQANQELDPQLQRIQWIDFRRGLRKLEILPQLLPEPAKLLKALGIVPMGNQIVLPPIIQTLYYFLTLATIATVIGWVVSFFQISSGPETQGEEIICLIPILLVFFAGVVFLMRRALINRRGRLASLRNFMFSILLLGFLVLIQLVVVGTLTTRPDANDLRGLAGAFGQFIYFIGLILVAPLLFWYWQDLKRWFPHKHKTEKLAVQQPQPAP